VPSAVETSLARRISGSPAAAMPATPSCTKLRRLIPSQYFRVFPASILNMISPVRCEILETNPSTYLYLTVILARGPIESQPKVLPRQPPNKGAASDKSLRVIPSPIGNEWWLLGGAPSDLIGRQGCRCVFVDVE